MMDLMFYEVRLKTGGKTDEQIKSDFKDDFNSMTKNDFKRYKRSMEMVDGQKVIVMKSNLEKDNYILVSWHEKDDAIWRDFIYIQEQDPYFGTYVGERESFLNDWEANEYEPSGSLVFNKDDVEVIRELPKNNQDNLHARD